MNEATEHTVYVIFDWEHEDQALYVGITNNFHKRMLDHKRNMPWANRFGRVDYYRMAHRRDALAAEYVLIDRHQPLHNVLKRRMPWQLQDLVNEARKAMEASA